MPLLRVNLSRTGPRIAGSDSLDRRLRQATKDLAPGAPVTLLIHGYKFSPHALSRTPHRHIFALEPKAQGPRVISWPRHLGFGKGRFDEGLCIAIGWEARGTIWVAYAEAGRMGEALADLTRRIRAVHDGPVCVLAHSLGARVALSSLHHSVPGELRRMVLIAGAEFRDRAAEAMATRAGRCTEVINIASKENALFDLLLERLVRPLDLFAGAIGHGRSGDLSNWLDLRIDEDTTRAGLASLGYRVPAPGRRVCHWSGYLRPGMFALHRALLTRPDVLPLARLREAACSAPRSGWSRFFARGRWTLPLPFWTNASS